MLQRVYIKILDNPNHWVTDAGKAKFPEPVENQAITEELKSELDSSYPSVVSVEYVDLFGDDDSSFPEIRELLQQGLITAPVVLINGVPRIHGGIPSSLIKVEVEKIISSGPVH
jgi:hypothetical protein